MNTDKTQLNIISWNVNSVRVRADQILNLAQMHPVDIIMMQEIKCQDHDFPAEKFTEAGFTQLFVAGQKSYHGVAIAARENIEIKSSEKLRFGLDEARHVGISLGDKFQSLNLHNFYFPSGGDIPDLERNAKFKIKFDYYRAVEKWLSDQPQAKPRVLMGDFNIAPDEDDIWNHKAQLKYVGHSPAETELYHDIRTNGQWTDAASLSDHAKSYTWWSARAKDAFSNDKGWRIDHCWLNAAACPSFSNFDCIRETRGWEKPSDHAPVLLSLNFGDN